MTMSDRPRLETRALSEGTLRALESLADQPHGQWWRDVLQEPDLVIAVRNDTLNAYHRGASIFRISVAGDKVVAETHVKYLVRQVQALATMHDGQAFDVDPAAVVWQRYQSPTTLKQMMRAAAPLMGPEKTGLHELVKRCTNVVDLEIALPLGIAASPETDEPEAVTEAVDGPLAEPDAVGPLGDDESPVHSASLNRLDVATIEERGVPNEAWLTFHEAKHFSNPELRARPSAAPRIVEQMQRYREALTSTADRLATSYADVCNGLLRLQQMRERLPSVTPGPRATFDPIIDDVAAGRRTLRVETEPRLLVFGFDADQRDGIWAAHRDRLEKEFKLAIYACGEVPRRIGRFPGGR